LSINTDTRDWEKYAKHHNKDYVNESWNNIGSLNPRFRHDFAFVDICNFYNPGVTRKDCERHFHVTSPAISRRLRENGFKNWTDFVKSYENDKVLSVEYYGIEDVYDITVDEYENFATDSVFSHNSLLNSSPKFLEKNVIYVLRRVKNPKSCPMRESH
jgi:hypothetical protein